MQNKHKALVKAKVALKSLEAILNGELGVDWADYFGADYQLMVDAFEAIDAAIDE